jgi:hypothetical protein
VIGVTESAAAGPAEMSRIAAAIAAVIAERSLSLLVTDAPP